MLPMTSASSCSSPPPSDPAFINDWSPSDGIDLPSSHSEDELEAIQSIRQETIVKRNQENRVIQHRAWKVDEAFRSDLDHPQDSPLSLRASANLLLYPSPSSSIMPQTFISSPVAYPPHSSPPVGKRPAPSTSNPSRNSKTIGGFLQDDSDDENGAENSCPAPKRRRLSETKSSEGLGEKPVEVLVPTSGNIAAPPASQNAKIVTTERPVTDDAYAALETERRSGPSNALKFLAAYGPNDKPSGTGPKRPFLNWGFKDSREVHTCSGKITNIRTKPKTSPVPFEELVAARSTIKVGRANKSYYGIDIQRLVDNASRENLQDESRKPANSNTPIIPIEQIPRIRTRKTLMWTEKYRAKRFFDLCGDDRTHREVLRWLKSWDPVVFPKTGKTKPLVSKRPDMDGEPEEKRRKILLLTGPPGLGKTTLAHVCATQAGYEIMEINASDERSSNVVKGRIRTSVGTESVKTVGTTVKDGQVKKAARPVCVVVDEVDGVVSGSGGSGEGGFIKALIELIQLDAKNESGVTTGSSFARKKKKGDDFRLLRPLILICNDVYHPSLRPLRQSNFAEIIHIRKPPLEAVVNRMKSVFQNEGVDCESDGIRKLCEATWGMSSGPETRFDASGAGEGDLRSILVVGEWAAGKLKSTGEAKPRLTRQWVEKNMVSDLSHGGGSARGVGRGGTKEVVSRVFLTGAGFPNPSALPFQTLPSKSSNIDQIVPKTKLHASEIAKKAGMDRLREIIDTSGESDRIVTDIFLTYPLQQFNDDSILSKPDSAYEWLHFYDTCSSHVYSAQDWELMPYLSQPILACHDLFASPAHHYSHAVGKKKWNEDGEAEEEKHFPFSGPRADYDAKEAEKSNRATIIELQSNLNVTLLRSFRSSEDIATDLLPYLVRMLTPEVKPIIVGGSGDLRGIASVRKETEREMVKRAVDVMSAVNVVFERGRLEGDFGSQPQWVYRMEPPLDTLTNFTTSSQSIAHNAAPVRYAVRQVLSQEHTKNIVVRENAARQARYRSANPEDDVAHKFSEEKGGRDKRINYDEVIAEKVKKDFFGRILLERDGLGVTGLKEGDGNVVKGKEKAGKSANNIWVTFHEGFSNAVRKPITVEELMRGL